MRDIETFLYIRSLTTRPWLSMLAAIDAELLARDRLPVNEMDLEVSRFLVATRVYLLGEGLRRPPVMDDAAFLLLKPLCETLVAQGRFSVDCLDLFDGLKPPAPLLPGATPEAKRT